jgi:hypothetical protein
MAKVWFVRRRGNEWIAPGGAPAWEAPLAEILFPLDLGTHRRVDRREAPLAARDVAAETPDVLQRVMVEVDAGDVEDRALSGYACGLYDSALSPRAAAMRLERIGRGRG